MNRFLVDKVDAKDKYVILNDPAQLHHLRDVLRIKPLELVAVFDNYGNEYITVVVEIGSLAVKLEIKEKRVHNDSGANVTVACAIPKKVKMDDIVDKLTQLGVERIIPLLTERVIVKIDAKNAQSKLYRWRKIAQSASEQSQRNIVPVIEPIEKITALLAKISRAGLNPPYDLKLIPTLVGQRRSLASVIAKYEARNEAAEGEIPEEVPSPSGRGQSQNIFVLIGPEGDFTLREIALAEKAGFLPVSLGAGVLRVDTAAIAVVSFIKLNEEH